MAKKISDKTRRTQEARKKQRQGYPAFYQSEIEKAHGQPCAECQRPLQGSSVEIAHIIMKSRNPELATLSDNILYLCESCHTKFDRSLEKRSTMDCFQKSIEQYRLIHEKVIIKSSEVIYYDNLISESIDLDIIN